MKITESFVEEILKADFSENYQLIYDESLLLQYLGEVFTSPPYYHFSYIIQKNF